MNISQMNYILAIASEANLTLAAKKLNLSQPALSIFLKKQEASLGVKLFFKARNKLLPTPEGIILIDAAKEIIRIKNRVYQAIVGIPLGDRVGFAFGGTPLRGAQIFGNIFSEFHNKYPNTPVFFKEGYVKNLLPQLLNKEICFIISTSNKDEQNSPIASIPLIKEELFFAIPMSHPLASIEEPNGSLSLTIEDLRKFANTPFVKPGPDTEIRDMMDAILTQAGISPPVIAETNNIAALFQMVSHEAGATFLPKHYLRPENNICYFSFNPVLDWEARILYLKDTPFTEQQLYFISLVQKYSVE